MPRILPLAVALALALAAGACGDEPTGAAAGDRDAAESATPAAVGIERRAVPVRDLDPASGPGLYRIHCSGCHGVDGDGNGTTELDRRPRDFVAGGFAFGNSREQLMRTISEGLPGNNPMPGFADELDEQQRGSVIDHILSLGPQRSEASRQERLLAVGDRPAVVRGHFGPVKEGGPSHARGLLIGFPGGTSLEYRADDLRLLAVRRGEFVDRTDWSGRGGQPLKPLGKIAKLVNDGDDFAPWSLAEGESEANERPLEAKLEAVEIRDDAVVLEYVLRDGDRTRVDVVETLTVVEQEGGATLDRAIELTPRGSVRLRRRDEAERADVIELAAGKLEMHRGMTIQHTVAAEPGEKE